MSDDNSELMAEFEEFLKAKKDKENKDRAAEDFDVEIWDETGKGVRTKRSHAKPFLQQLGLDVDPPSSDDKSGDSKDDNGGNNTRKSPVKKQSSNSTSSGVATKYFTRDKKS